jgi:hypothetical protein
MKKFARLLNYFGYYNLNSSKKYRFVKELYEETATMIRMHSLVEMVLKNYFSEMSEHEIQNASSTNQKPKLFQYWHQGFDELPGVVKNCYKSVDFFLGDDFEIIRIELKTLSKYIKLPVHILQSRNDGNMTIAHFSDIVRNKLLLEYGGMWLDSTVLITGKEDIHKFTSLNNRLMFSRFVFSNPKEHAVQFESWIMWSKCSGNMVFKIADKVLSEYWRKNKDVGNYFLYHIILTIIFLKEDKFRKKFNWHDRFYLGNSGDLGRYLIGRKYSPLELSMIMNKTDIHKLDFKQSSVEKSLFGGRFFDDLFFEDILSLKA